MEIEVRLLKSELNSPCMPYNGKNKCVASARNHPNLLAIQEAFGITQTNLMSFASSFRLYNFREKQQGGPREKQLRGNRCFTDLNQ